MQVSGDTVKAPFLVLTTKLKELDLKCLPLPWDSIDEKTLQTQLKLGQSLMEALIRWGTAPPEEADTMNPKIEQDVRNHFVKVPFQLFFPCIVFSQ